MNGSSNLSIPPRDMVAFAHDLEHEIRRLNTYYDDLIAGKILNTLQITLLSSNAFKQYMQSHQQARRTKQGGSLGQ